jgi:hypothetical protein
MSLAVASTGTLVQRGTGVAGANKAITSSSVANPSIITTAAHSFVSGDFVSISGHSGATPNINGTYAVTVLSSTTFSIPVNVTVGGTGGNAALVETVFNTVGELVTVSPPGFTRNKLETTTHNDGAESNILGIIRQKDGSFRINFVGTDTTHTQLMTDFLQNVRATWRFRFPSGTTLTGSGRVQQFQIVDAPVDAIQQADCNIVWAAPVAMFAA